MLKTTIIDYIKRDPQLQKHIMQIVFNASWRGQSRQYRYTRYLILIDPRKHFLNYILLEKVFQIKLTLFRKGHAMMARNFI